MSICRHPWHSTPDPHPNGCPVCVPNPFESPILRGNYGAANELKSLAVNLFNNSVKPDMASIMRRDRDHRELAIAMLEHYAEYGEGCPVFMEVARSLAAEVHGFEEDDDTEAV